VPLEPGFFLHRSNRTEQLLEALVEVVREPASDDPLAPECIAVQGRGMERWLSMSLSRHLGVWARPEFPVVRELLESCADRIIGEEAERGRFDPGPLTFAFADALTGLVETAPFRTVASYLEGDDGGRRLMGLAERLALIFDAYATQRPDWLAAWSSGRRVPELIPDAEVAGWQAILWKTVLERSGDRSHDARMRETIDAIDAGAVGRDGLPARISVFGLSSISPLHTHVLAALARVVPVHLFVLAPTDAWWGDLRSLREQWRAARRGGEPVAASADERAAIEGHPLLAAFGRLGRDFQQSLESSVDYLEPGPERFIDPLVESLTEAERPSLLRRLQSRMMRLDAGGDSGIEAAAEDDPSLRIHVCHSPQREVEVLHDRLLDLFERDPTLEPDDVVVMSPDIERHAPLIGAVFARRSAESGRPHIPYRIADRSIVITREGVAAFLQLLDTISGRFAAAPVLDLLAMPSVARRHGLDADDVARLDRWVERAGIRWGLDGAQRVEEGLPDDDVHTWRYGLDRLLLGVAMDPGDAAPWEGRLAVDGVEGEDARLVGVLASFIESLAWARSRARRNAGPSEWAGFFRELCDRFVSETEDNAHHLQNLRDAFDSLARCAELSGSTFELGLPAVRGLLLRSLRASTPSYGFLSGGVTFCEMVPMRSIPFRVVCMLGLDDDAFPRIRRAPGFDLMGRHARLGDRSTRDDDRSLFLEALLSARDHLVLSYVGRDVRDGEPRPPSVVVSELVDAVREEIGAPAADALPGWIVQHPLKAFSPRYFGGHDEGLEGDAEPVHLTSYDSAALRGARALSAPREDSEPFASAGDAFVPHDEAPDRLELKDLVDFLRHASRRFLRETLELRVDSPEAPERDREPAGLDPLARWRVGDAVLQGIIEGVPDDATAARLRAAGDLPPGALGDQWLEDVTLEAHRLAQKQVEVAGFAPLDHLDVDLEVGGVRLVGRVQGMTGPTRVRCSFAKLGGTSELDAWIEHLAVCATRGGDDAFETILIGRQHESSTLVRFLPVSDASERLEELVAIWRAGRERPVPFFPKSARVYAEKLDGVSDAAAAADAEGQASQNAYREYRGDETGYDTDRSEREREADVRLLWRGRDALARGTAGHEGEAPEDFRGLALRIYGPMLAARKAES